MLLRGQEQPVAIEADSSVNVRRFSSRHESDAYAEYVHTPASECDGVAKKKPDEGLPPSITCSTFPGAADSHVSHEEPDRFAAGLQVMTARTAIAEIAHRCRTAGCGGC